jgi:hypothetical protein
LEVFMFLERTWALGFSKYPPFMEKRLRTVRHLKRYPKYPKKIQAAHYKSLITECSLQLFVFVRFSLSLETHKCRLTLLLHTPNTSSNCRDLQNGKQA